MQLRAEVYPPSFFSTPSFFIGQVSLRRFPPFLLVFRLPLLEVFVLVFRSGFSGPFLFAQLYILKIKNWGYIPYSTIACTQRKIKLTCHHEESIQISHLSEQGTTSLASVDVWVLPLRV